MNGIVLIRIDIQYCISFNVSYSAIITLKLFDKYGYFVIEKTLVFQNF